MQRVALGRTGLNVSRLCLGTGSHGQPCIQSLMEESAMSDILRHAWQSGITFWDTALGYGTHRHVAHALRTVPRNQLQLATKTHAATADKAEESLHRALRELGTTYVDLFVMHEIDSPEEFADRAPARRRLQQLKGASLRAVGMSTHSIDALELAVEHPDIDVLFTNVNMAGIHMDADLSHYVKALRTAYRNGKGVYVHKTLGEGALAHRLQEALRHNLALDCVHSVCVGIKTQRELDELLQAWQNIETPSCRQA